MIASQRASMFLFAACGLLLGCTGGATPPSTGSVPDSARSQPTIVGKWTSSTAPEMAQSATTIVLLESGEYQISGPLEIEGKFVDVEIDGKKQIAPFNGSGTWELKGDVLQVHVMNANLSGWKGEPSSFKVLDLTDQKLVLQQNGTDRAYFRIK